MSEALALGTHEDAFDPLVVAARQGERQAWLELYRRHQHRVRAFARRLLGSPADADDLVHDVFADLPRILGNYRAKAPLESFLLGVAARRAQHFTRTAKRRHHYESAAPIAQAEPGPDVTTERLQLAEKLQNALDALPLEQRVAFVMCEIEERSSVEVAEILGERDGTIRARLLLARRKLRAIFEGERAEGEAL